MPVKRLCCHSAAESEDAAEVGEEEQQQLSNRLGQWRSAAAAAALRAASARVERRKQRPVAGCGCPCDPEDDDGDQIDNEPEIPLGSYTARWEWCSGFIYCLRSCPCLQRWPGRSTAAGRNELMHERGGASSPVNDNHEGHNLRDRDSEARIETLLAAVDGPLPSVRGDDVEDTMDPLERLAIEGAENRQVVEAVEALVGDKNEKKSKDTLQPHVKRRLGSLGFRRWCCGRAPGRLYSRRQGISNANACCSYDPSCVMSWWSCELLGLWVFVVVGSMLTVAGMVFVVLETKADTTGQDVLPGDV